MRDMQQQELRDDSSGRPATAGRSEGAQPAAAGAEAVGSKAAAADGQESSTSRGLLPQARLWSLSL